MISKQLKYIICILIAVAVLAVLAIIVPIIVKDGEQGPDKLVLLDGEAEGSDTKPRIMEELEKGDIAKITIDNSHGTLTFVNDEQWGVTYIEDYKEFMLDSTKLESLYNRVSSLIVTRVDTEPKDLSAYGLDAESKPASFTVTKKDGTTHKVYFGYMTADNTAYYVMYEGRNVVYTLYNSNIEKTVLAPVNDYISTLVAPELAEMQHVGIQNIIIRKNGKDFIKFEMTDEEYRNNSGYLLSHRMTYPANYLVNLTNLEKLLSSFCSLSGDRVVDYGLYADDKFEKLNSYGFNKTLTEIEYTYNDIVTVIYVGPKTDDGTAYYVYSLLYDVLVTVPTEKLPFVEWGLGDYIGETLFQMDIDHLDVLEVSAADVNAVFTFEGEEDELKVLCNGEYLGNNDDGKYTNFRNFYKYILRLRWHGYADDKVNDTEPLLNLKITTDFGEIFDYKFYQTSTLRCYLEYNGSGEFYTEKSMIDDFIHNFKRIVNNEIVE